MAFSTATPPKRSGDYTRFASKKADTLPLTTGAIVAIPFTDDWGPFEVPTLIQSWAEFLETYGQPVDPANLSEGHLAVYNAFKGGAGSVLCYRTGGSAAAKASKGLAAGATTPAITLTAVNEGIRGNEFKVAVVANAATPATKVDVELYYGSTKIATFYNYGSADITTLQADINRQSKVVVASGATNGTKLDLIAATALTGGNNGTAMVAGDWTGTGGVIEKLEPQRFGVFAPANLTDSSVRTALEAWCISKNAAEKAKRFFLVEGGSIDETFATAAGRSAASNNENVVNLGVGRYRDTSLDLDVSTAQLAPRLAGLIASKGGRESISFVYLQDIEIVSGPSEQDILDALDQGVVVIGLGTGGAQFQRGVTTYTTTSNSDKDFETYSRIKYVATMQDFERGGKEANETGDVLGKLPVNNDTREFIIDREQGRLNEYIERKEVQPGAKVSLAVDPPPSDDDEFIAVDWVGKFGRTLEQIRRTVYFT